jgi:MFS family permease
MNQPVPDPRELISVAPAGTPTPPVHDPYAALRYRAYRLFALGGIVAGIGQNMRGVAIGWELYERTGSAMALGWVGLAQALPIILLALPAGHLADRYPRKNIILVSLSVTVLCSIGLMAVSLSRAPVGWMYFLLVVGAVARAFNWPASAAILPSLVPKEVFSNAVTWRSSGFQVASVLGPALGGFLIGTTKSAAVVYGCHAGLTTAYLVFVAMLTLPVVARSKEAASLQSLLAGFGFVWRTKVILAAITLDMFAVLLGGATALLPIFAKDILQVGPAGLGWLRAAPAVGAFVMAMILAHRPPIQNAGKTLLWAVAGFGIVIVVFGLSKSFWLSMGALILSGAFDNISVVVRHSLVQLRTPDEMRGRVSAVNTVFISSSNELGEFESGTVAAWFGPVVSVVSGGIGTLLVVLGVSRLWPEIRKLRTLHE